MASLRAGIMRGAFLAEAPLMRYRAFRMASLASCLYQRSVPLAELTAVPPRRTALSFPLSGARISSSSPVPGRSEDMALLKPDARPGTQPVRVHVGSHAPGRPIR